MSDDADVRFAVVIPTVALIEPAVSALIVALTVTASCWMFPMTAVI